MQSIINMSILKVKLRVKMKEIAKPLTNKEIKNWEMAKINKYLTQWAPYDRSKGGHFPDCNLDKCECNKFFLSKD